MSILDAFNQFRSERIREAIHGFEEVINNKQTGKELFKAYNRWAVTAPSRPKRIPAEVFNLLCENIFGDSKGKKEYLHIKVFLDEEDIEDFDKEHQLTANSEPVSSEVMANHILNSENKIELVRGLIEDKRALSFEVDKLEEVLREIQQKIADALATQ